MALMISVMLTKLVRVMGIVGCGSVQQNLKRALQILAVVAPMNADILDTLASETGAVPLKVIRLIMIVRACVHRETVLEVLVW